MFKASPSLAKPHGSNAAVENQIVEHELEQTADSQVFKCRCDSAVANAVCYAELNVAKRG